MSRWAGQIIKVVHGDPHSTTTFTNYLHVDWDGAESRLDAFKRLEKPKRHKIFKVDMNWHNPKRRRRW